MAAVAIGLFAAACGGGDDDVVLLTHDSFFVSEELLAEFTDRTGITVTVVRGGDAGAMVNQAVLTRDNPLGDVMFGVDTTFLSRALEADLFEPYVPARAADVRAEIRFEDDRVVPIDYGDVCLNYDRTAFGDDLPPPQRLDDLTDPRYRGMTVVQDPSTSSPGLAFLLATIARFGETGDYTWRDYWADLRRNDVQVTAGWEEAYYGSFSGAGEGDRPIVVSYASSPPAEIIFAETPIDEPSTAVIADGCFRQVEYAGILAGTDARDAAEQLVDFLLSDAFQADVPLQMLVFPAVDGTPLPDVFVEHAAVPADPLSLDPADIEANRSAWIDAWTDVVLR